MIPRETIDRIYAAAHIEEVISDYVTLRKRGANLIGLCPFHDEKTGSFTVSPAKGIYKCFGCGKAGNAVNFIMEYEQCNYTEALRMLAKRYHIEIQERELTTEEKALQDERESMFKVNEWANKWLQEQLWQTDEGRNIGLKYFIERGIREDIIRKFQLGYSPDRNAFYPAAGKAGYADEFLEKTGLCGKGEKGYYDRFRGRVMFPIFTVSGKVVAFAGRILKTKEHVGKYVNSPESSIYSKQNELYGLSHAKQAIAKTGQCYLVEGQMDVISMHQAGIENVVSSGGTALTHRQILLLHRFTENVTILYDGDAAGIHAALRGIDMLLEQGLNIKVVLLPDGEDPDSFSHKHNAADFIEYIQSHQQDFIRFKTNLLLRDAGTDPIKRSEVVRSIMQSIAVIPEIITRQIYIKDCSNLLDIPENALLKEVDKLRKRHAEELQKRRERERDKDNADTNTTTTDEIPDSPAVNVQTIPIPLADPLTYNILEKNILNLLQVLIRYGEHTLCQDETGAPCTAGEYILADLENDDIQFDNPLYQTILAEYKKHHTEDGFVAETFFKYHPNGQISTLAVELISEKYQLSKIHGHQNISENIKAEVQLPTDADRLTELIPHLLFELKLTLVNQKIAELKLMLKTAQENNDEELMFTLLQQQPLLESIKRQLCNELGQRIILIP